MSTADDLAVTLLRSNFEIYDHSQLDIRAVAIAVVLERFQ
jgi:hypothetical protein